MGRRWWLLTHNQILGSTPASRVPVVVEMKQLLPEATDQWCGHHKCKLCSGPQTAAKELPEQKLLEKLGPSPRWGPAHSGEGTDTLLAQHAARRGLHAWSGSFTDGFEGSDCGSDSRVRGAAAHEQWGRMEHGLHAKVTERQMLKGWGPPPRGSGRKVLSPRRF